MVKTQEESESEIKCGGALLKQACKMLQHDNNTSIFQSPHEERALPTFTLDELEIGYTLGIGTYGTIQEVSNIKLLKKSLPATSEEEEKNREIMATRCLRKRCARYAVKSLTKGDLTPLERMRGRIDLALEVKYLKALDHPNIIRLRGIMKTKDPFHPDYFFIMDRLHGTLEDRIEGWKDDKKDSGGGLFKKKDKELSCVMTLERLVAAFDLASAFNYLHDKRVIHRDIRPDNIGFDVRGDVKVFDFGLAKYLHPNLRASQGLYHLTARVGSFPYMAPEVAKVEPYNEKCDIFSFGMVLYEIMALQKPFASIKSRREYHKKIAVAGSRPSLSRNMCPKLIQKVIKSCWNQIPQNVLVWN